MSSSDILRYIVRDWVREHGEETRNGSFRLLADLKVKGDVHTVAINYVIATGKLEVDQSALRAHGLAADAVLSLFFNNVIKRDMIRAWIGVATACKRYATLKIDGKEFRFGFRNHGEEFTIVTPVGSRNHGLGRGKIVQALFGQVVVPEALGQWIREHGVEDEALVATPYGNCCIRHDPTTEAVYCGKPRKWKGKLRPSDQVALLLYVYMAKAKRPEKVESEFDCVVEYETTAVEEKVSTPESSWMAARASGKLLEVTKTFVPSIGFERARKFFAGIPSLMASKPSQ